MNTFLRKFIKKIDFSIVLIVILFLAIIGGPYLISQFNQQEKEKNQTHSQPELSAPANLNNNQTKTAVHSENDLTNPKKVETDLTIPAADNQSTTIETDESLDQSSDLEKIALSTPSESATPEPATANNQPDQGYIIEENFVPDDNQDLISEPIIIDESPAWEESYYEYQDDIIEVDFGDKDTSDETSQKVIYQAPTWQKRDGLIMTMVSDWFDRITNQNIKSIEFALVNAYDSRHDNPDSLTYNQSYFANDLWNEFKNFFARIYQNSTDNIVLTHENGQNIIINKSVLKNINVKYQIIPNKGIKEEIILNSPEDIFDSFIFNLQLQPGIKYHRNTDLMVEAPTDIYYFTDDQNRYFAHFVPLYAQDADGNKTENVSMQIDLVENNNHKITISVDPDWIYDTNRKFPIIIDPSIVHDTQTEFDTAASLNRVQTTSGPSIELSDQPGYADNSVASLFHLDEIVDNSAPYGADAFNNGYYNYNGVATGTTIVDGKFGKARDFNGTSDMMCWADYNRPVNNFTMEAWFTVDSTHGIDSESTSGINGSSGQRWLFYPNNEGSSSSGAGISVGTNGISVYEHGNSYVPALAVYNATLPSGWNHVAVVYQNKQPKIYLNGSLVRTGLTSPRSNVYIPYCLGGANYGWHDGKIDEVYITNRALAPTEFHISTHPNNGIYTSNVLDLGSNNPLLDTISWTENGVQTGNGETDLTDASLVAKWDFNETSGTTANDISGNNNNGTLTSMITTGQDDDLQSGWTANDKKWGSGAMRFDGSNDYVSVAHNSNLQPSTAVTVATWVKFDDFYAGSCLNNMLVAKGEDTQNGFYGLRVNDTAGCGTATGVKYANFVLKFSDGTYGAASTPNGSIQKNTWYYLVGTYDGTAVKIYLNGVLSSTTNISKTISSGTNILTIGRMNHATYPYWFNGTMDATSIYTRALSASEIASLYNSSNIEFQTRTGADNNPYDGGWEEWKPAGAGTETQIQACDVDQTNWSWDSTSTYSPKNKSDDTTIKIEGSGSLNIENGILLTDANTIALWHLDETGGSGAYIKDSSGNGNDGTPTGTTVVNGINSQARSFNGTSNNIAKTSVSAFSLKTVSMWFKPTTTITSASACQLLLQPRLSGTAADYFNIMLGSCTGTLTNETLSISSDNTGRTGLISYSFNASTWYKADIVWNGSTYDIYINGAKQSVTHGTSGSTSAPLLTDANIIRIGSYIDYAGTQSSYFNGQIDELLIKNESITSEEVAESYRLSRDHTISRSLTSTDLSAKNKLAFYVASDQPGSKLDLTIGESAFANYLPDANTVGLWHLEEASGTGAYLKDSSSYNNHATPTGATYVSGYLGQARNFNASSTYLLVSDSASLRPTDDFSISAWIKPGSVGGEQHILHKYTSGSGNGYGIYIASNNLSACVGCVSGNDCSVSDSTVDTNTWQYYTFTFNRSGGFCRLYKNGVLISANTSTGTPAVSSTIPLGIGRRGDSASGYYYGIIDEPRIDNIARTPDEIRQSYEVSKRTHSVNFDFAANLDSANVIAGSGDYSFTVDATTKGLSSKGAGLYVGDKIIIRENYDGTEYISQGTVDAVNATTGAVIVASWDAGSTFPSGGYSQYADAFKWQREYFDLTGIMDSHIDAVTQINLRPKNSTSANTFWLDDINSVSNYLTNPAGSELTSSDNQYLQYRAIFTTTDSNITPSISNVTINFNDAPDPSFTSAATSQSSLNNNNKTAFNLQCVGVTVYSAGTTECQGSWDNTNWNTIGSVTGSQNNVTIQGTPDVSLWTDYPADGNQTVYLRIYNNSTGYDTKTLVIDKDTLTPTISLINSVAGDISAPYIDGTDDGTTIVSFVSAPDSVTCKWNVTDIDYDSMANTCTSTSSCTINLVSSGSHTVFFRCQDDATNKATTSYQLDYSILWSGYSQVIEFDQPTPESDYQVRVDLNTSNFNFANAQSAGQDIRFTDIENNPLNYWIQEWTANTSAKIWVKVATANTKYIKMHFGNPAATSESNGDNTFIFFDDFNDGSLSTQKWNTYFADNGPDPTISETGGKAVLFTPYRDSSKTVLYSDNSFSRNTILETRASVDFGGSCHESQFGFDINISRPDYHSYINFVDDNLSNNNIYLNNNRIGYGGRSYTSIVGDINVYHDYKIIWNTDLIQYYRDEIFLGQNIKDPNYITSWNLINTDPMPIAFGNMSYCDSGGDETNYVDWILLRKHTENDIVSSLSSEKTLIPNDVLPPNTVTVSQVEGDTTNTWTDTGDNDITTITMNTPADTAFCKWDIVDTNYDSMSGVCESTSSCTVDSTAEGTYHFYIRCMDFSGNKADLSKHIEVIVDYYWEYNREITLNTATTMTNQQVRLDFTAINFNYSNIKADGSDIRFTDNSNNFLDYWIETWNNGGNSKVWVEIPTTGTDKIKILYGNNLHIDRSNGDTTFLFFDGFNGASIDSNKWYYDAGDVYNSYQGSAEVENGLLDIYIPQVPYLNTDVVSKTTFGYNTSLEARASIDFGGDRTESGLGYGSYRTRGLHGITETIDFWDASGSDTDIYSQSYTTAQGLRAANGSPDSADINVWHNYKIGRTQNNPTYYRDDTLLATYTYSTAPQGNIPIAIDNDSPSNAGIYPDSSEHLYVDWILIRNYNGTEPTFQTLGDEQSSQTSFPGVNAITSVTDDTSSPYVDVTDNSTTLVTFTTVDNPINVKWDIIDTNYDSMAGNCGSITECDITLAGEGVKTVYFRAIDAGGNKSTSSYILTYTIDLTRLSNLLSSSLPNESDLTLTVNFVPSFSQPITDGSIKLIMADEFDFTGLTINDVSASGGDVTWTNDEQIYAGGIQIAHRPSWFYDIAYAQGENSITFNFTGDISSEDGEITFIISGINQPGNPPTEGSYSYIVEWYEQHNAGGSPLYIKDGKVHINEGTIVSASIPTAFTFTINPVASGTVNGANITEATTIGSAVNFGIFTDASDRIAAHDLIVSSNTTGGYQITTQYTNLLSSDTDNMADFTGTNSIPTTWASPPGSGTESYFGYTTNDATLSESAINRFTSSGGNKWAGFNSNPAEVSYHDGPANDQTDRVGYRLQITNLQPAGIYTTNIVYIATPTY